MRYVTIGIAMVIMLAAMNVDARSETRVVTVQELIDADHRLTVPAGTVVEWRDPHFDTVWLPPSSNGPRAERRSGVWTTEFATPGTYRGRFTVAGGHRSNDVYPFTVTVTDR